MNDLALMTMDHRMEISPSAARAQMNSRYMCNEKLNGKMDKANEASADEDEAGALTVLLMGHKMLSFWRD